MPEIVTQPSFAAGEIGPQLYGRVDQALYYIGLRTCRNFIIRQYGGAANRSGSKIISEHKYQGKKVRLIPFSFNSSQNYVLQVGDGYTRFIRNGGEVLESVSLATISGATSSNPVTLTFSSGHPFNDGDDIFVSGMEGMVELNGRTMRVANATALTVDLKDSNNNDVVGTLYSSYTAGGTAYRVYEVETPWQEADLFSTGSNDPSINWAQDNDVLTVAHNEYYPRDLTRSADDVWTVSEFPNKGGPFLPVNLTDTTVYSDAVDGSVTLTASDDIFNADMVGELFFIEQEPDDDTQRWEAATGYRDNGIARAGSHYYRAPEHNVSASISGITVSSVNVAGIVTTSGAHNLSNDDTVYISGVNGMEEVNDSFFKVLVKTSTTFALLKLTGSIQSTNTYTAYSSGGTVEKAHYSGTYRPDWTEGSSSDGTPGITWTYLHSGSGIVEIDTFNSATSVDATVINRLPERVVGSGNTTDNWAKAAWSVDQGYPGSCGYHKERFALAGTKELPNYIWMSGSDLRADFSKSFPLLDDEAITIPLKTRGANSIRHLIPFSELIALTSASEHLVDGVDGTLLATGDNFNKVQGYTGSSYVPPIVVNDIGLFVQDLGGVVRSLEYTLDSDKYKGIDLTARSPHMFEGRRIVDWDYQRHPFSCVWVILDNGELLGFTFMEEQQVYAWHRHDSGNAKYESVACIREGIETATYFSLTRTINGNERRYVERMSSRTFDDVRDAFFVDSGLTYDGRNTGTTTVAITGGTNWDTPESLTITASDDIFLATDVDTAQLVFWVGNIAYRLDITGFTSKSVVTGVPVKELPNAYRNANFTDWEIARSVFQPLHHLEGEAVSVLSDGNVVLGKTVDNGKITLTSPGAVVHVGLGYVCDLETLDMARPQGQTKAKTFNVPRVFLTLEKSRAVYVSTEGLNSDDTLTNERGAAIPELKQREPQDGYDIPIPAETELFEIHCNSTWSKNGRIAIRQTYPLPVTVNGISPEVEIGKD